MVLQIYELRVDNHEKRWTERFYVFPIDDKIFMSYQNLQGKLDMPRELNHGWNLYKGGEINFRSLTKEECERFTKSKYFVNLISNLLKESKN